ncbi:transposase [Tenacibaculum dicentrarchi]|uniref:Transposase n=1 Tax=Tenacibaculum finnmarkense genomovar ulcerans TaxID=2781388 RepID=A0A2I2MA35_9FLAO|nr:MULTISPECIES: transposase [Tenacibaculum]ALU75317.1 transposase [Tenacibaculum dicentrarchi]MBE7646676.1 transposase [Tenacibaculum finnmarkense genomovar ulcerans]MBE7685079.1 transposase [Tenacibaculum piscium]MBE7688879.1 transposase [Tenacibaculum finnmarkense genomovar ulcerans]MBE7698625.1 transposase [Tenacibaculum finnmarkense genomovar ulcerans]
MKYESLESGNYYHIFNQGNNGENIFIEDENYSYFLKLIKTHICSIADVFSYCLLKNHFHLLVQIKESTDEKLVSKAFSNFFNSYSKSINKRYDRSGSLFRDRFKRIKIADEIYLKKLIVYINLNPIYHGFVTDINLYRNSSYLSLISDKNTLLKREAIYLLFGDRDNFINHLIHKKLEFDEKLSVLVLE